MGNSAAEMLINFSQSLPGIQTFIVVIFAAIGVVLVGSAIVTYYQEGSSMSSMRRAGFFAVAMKVLFGSLCLSLPWLLDTVAGTFFTETDTLYVESGVPLDADIKIAVLMTIVNLMAVIGFIAGGRGLLTLASGPVNQQPGWVASGITLIGVGAILTNFYIAADYIARTFGMGALGTEYFKF